MKRLTQTLAFCLLTVFTAVAQKTMYPKYGFPGSSETANTKIRYSMPIIPIRTLAV